MADTAGSFPVRLSPQAEEQTERTTNLLMGMEASAVIDRRAVVLFRVHLSGDERIGSSGAASGADLAPIVMGPQHDRGATCFLQTPSNPGIAASMHINHTRILIH